MDPVTSIRAAVERDPAGGPYESLHAARERKLGVAIGRELGTVIRLAEAAVL